MTASFVGYRFAYGSGGEAPATGVPVSAGDIPRGDVRETVDRPPWLDEATDEAGGQLASTSASAAAAVPALGASAVVPAVKVRPPPSSQASPPSTPRDVFANLRERAASFVSGFLPNAAPPVNVRQRAVTSAPRAQPTAPSTNFVDSIIMRAAPARPPATPPADGAGECSSFAMWWQQHLQPEHSGYVERGWEDA